jgi:hypothetical protein
MFFSSARKRILASSARIYRSGAFTTCPWPRHVIHARLFREQLACTRLGPGAQTPTHANLLPRFLSASLKPSTHMAHTTHSSLNLLLIFSFGQLKFSYISSSSQSIFCTQRATTCPHIPPRASRRQQPHFLIHRVKFRPSPATTARPRRPTCRAI